MTSDDDERNDKERAAGRAGGNTICGEHTEARKHIHKYIFFSFLINIHRFQHTSVVFARRKIARDVPPPPGRRPWFHSTCAPGWSGKIIGYMRGDVGLCQIRDQRRRTHQNRLREWVFILMYERNGHSNSNRKFNLLGSFDLVARGLGPLCAFSREAYQRRSIFRMRSSSATAGILLWEFAFLCRRKSALRLCVRGMKAHNVARPAL